MNKIFTKQFNSNGKNLGFTVIEILIVVGIAGVLLLALVGLFIGYNNYFGYLQSSIDVPQSAGLVITAVENAVRQADQILSSRSFSGTIYVSDTNGLVLELPSVDSSGNILAGKHDYIAFYKSDTEIYSLTEADVSSVRISSLKKLSDTANSLVFTYDNADVTLAQKVDVSIQNSKQIRDQIIQSNLHQQVYFRNK
jgi:hypothetical protein